MRESGEKWGQTPPVVPFSKIDPEPAPTKACRPTLGGAQLTKPKFAVFASRCGPGRAEHL